MTILRLLVLIIIFCFLALTFRKMPVKPKPCVQDFSEGYTFVTVDSVINNCGEKVYKRRYKPF